MPNFRLSTFNFDVRVQVNILSYLTYSDVSGLLDELNDRWTNVQASRTTFNPPAAGAQETLLNIIISAGSGILTKVAWDLFFSEILGNAGKRIQAHLVALLRRGSRNAMTAAYKPLSITCGKVRFYIPGELTEEELVACFREAHRIGSSLPDNEFEDDDSVRSPDCYYDYWWDQESGLWLPGVR